MIEVQCGIFILIIMMMIQSRYQHEEKVRALNRIYKEIKKDIDKQNIL